MKSYRQLKDKAPLQTSFIHYIQRNRSGGFILRSDTTSQIMPFSRKCFLRHHGGQLKTAFEQEAGEVDRKR